MTLYLVEDDRQERTKEQVSEILERIATVASKSQGELIEALIGGAVIPDYQSDRSRLPRTSTRKRWARLATNQGNALDWAGLSHCARAQRQSQLSSTVEFTSGANDGNLPATKSGENPPLCSSA